MISIQTFFLNQLHLQHNRHSKIALDVASVRTRDAEEIQQTAIDGYLGLLKSKNIVLNREIYL